MNKQTYFTSVDHFMSQKPLRPYLESINLHTREQINKIIKNFDRNYLINKRKEMTVNLIRYNVDGEWIDRFNNGDMYKHDGLSIDACISKYGTEIGTMLHNERRKNLIVDKTKYSLEKWNSICKSKASNLGLDGYIRKYGKTEGTNRWNAYLLRWRRGIEIRKNEGNWKNGLTLEEYQERWGIEGGYIKWKRRIDNRSHTLSLQGHIEKYGKLAGAKKWKSYCKSNNKTSLEAFVKRHGEVMGTARYSEMLERLSRVEHNFKSYSKVSQELFHSISNSVPDKKTKFATNGGEEYYFINEVGLRSICVDFKCENVIIEFYGDYWHMNPSLYNHNDINKFKDKTAKDIWKHDKRRIDWLKHNGYKVLIVWESDYNKNKEQTIQKCIEFINENYEKTQVK